MASLSSSVYRAKNEFSTVKLFRILKSLNIAYLAEPALYASILKEQCFIEKYSFLFDNK